MIISVTEIQAPLYEQVDTCQVSHMWRCVWGPHPRSAIVAETNCVSIIEFRNEEVTYTPLIEQVVLFVSIYFKLCF